MADIDELRRQVLAKRVEKKRAAAAIQPKAAVQTPDIEPNPMDSMLMGSSIAENMPGGKTLADIGSKIGSGIAAATMTKPGEGYFDRLGENYRQGQIAMDEANQTREMIDAANPVTSGVKEVIGQLPFMAQKRSAASEPVEPETGPGQFKYPGDTRTEKIKNYLQRQKLGSKAGSLVKQEAEEMLPYPIRKALSTYRTFTK